MSATGRRFDHVVAAATARAGVTSNGLINNAGMSPLAPVAAGHLEALFDQGRGRQPERPDPADRPRRTSDDGHRGGSIINIKLTGVGQTDIGGYHLLGSESRS